MSSTTTFAISIFKRYRGQMVVVVFTLFIATILELISLAALLPLMDTLLKGSLSQEGTAYELLKFFYLADIHIVVLLFLVLLFMILRTLLLYLSRLITGWISVKLEKDLRQDMFESLLYARWDLFMGKRAGTLSNLMSAEATKAGTCANLFAVYIVNAILTLFFCIAGFFASPASFIALCVVSLPLMMVASYLQKETRKAAIERLDEGNHFNSRALEFLSHIKYTKASHKEKEEAQRFAKHADQMAHLQYKVVDYGSLIAVIPDAITVILVTFLIFIAQVFALGSAQNLIFFLLIAFRGQRFLGQAQTNLQKVVSFLPSYFHCCELIEEAKAANEAIMFSGKREPHFENKIVFENVGFNYQGDYWNLRDISLTLPKNMMIGLVGKSGSGKTTLVDLIVGLINPTSGRILIDNHDLSDVNLYQWRTKIAYVSQSPVIFYGSIRENLCRDAGHIEELYLQEIAEITGIKQFSDSLTGGLESIIEDHGANLSGGQKQRIALARALIQKPDILILDEATSALDGISEAEMNRAVQKMRGLMTIIVIAHRFSNVKDADLIVVMDEGRIAGQGTYETLLSQDKLFQALETFR